MSEKISMFDTSKGIIVKMAEGNPGAVECLCRLMKDTESIDPDAAFGGLTYILTLDSYNIYGSAIYVLWNDICDRDLVKMLSVLRAAQLGIFDYHILKIACSKQDYSGRKMIPVQELYEKVTKELPRFNATKQTT